MTVAPQQRILDGFANLIGPGLPGAEANGRDLVAGVKGEGFPNDVGQYEYASLFH